MHLKPIDEQIMVLTGATSGMGLVTARMASNAGARLVLVARDEETLRKLSEELTSKGHEAIYVVADVTQEAEVQKIADRAIEHFGGFDTWVNLVGLVTYGELEKVDIEDHRRIFEINYWSVVYGSITAARHLRERGGAIINMGSILSDRAVPYQGPYTASKHAIKAFTDSFRMELQHDGAPVSVTLVKPSSMDTPLRHHGKNYMSKEPENPPPAYNPELTAEVIIHCAQYPKRDVVVGGGGKLVTALANMAPGLADYFMAKTMDRIQTTKNPAGPRSQHSLYGPSGDGRERGGTSNVLKHSPYTQMQLHPKTTALVLGVGAGLLTMAIAGRRSGRKRRLARQAALMSKEALMGKEEHMGRKTHRGTEAFMATRGLMDRKNLMAEEAALMGEEAALMARKGGLRGRKALRGKRSLMDRKDLMAREAALMGQEAVLRGKKRGLRGRKALKRLG